MIVEDTAVVKSSPRIKKSLTIDPELMHRSATSVLENIKDSDP